MSRPFPGGREPSRVVDARPGHSRASERSPGASAPISIVPNVSRPCVHAFTDIRLAARSAMRRTQPCPARRWTQPCPTMRWTQPYPTMRWAQSCLAMRWTRHSSDASSMRLTRVDASFSSRPPVCAQLFIKRPRLCVPVGCGRRISLLVGCDYIFPILDWTF